jgi:hypothetical protein
MAARWRSRSMAPNWFFQASFCPARTRRRRFFQPGARLWTNLARHCLCTTSQLPIQPHLPCLKTSSPPGWSWSAVRAAAGRLTCLSCKLETGRSRTLLIASSQSSPPTILLPPNLHAGAGRPFAVSASSCPLPTFSRLFLRPPLLPLRPAAILAAFDALLFVSVSPNVANWGGAIATRY